MTMRRRDGDVAHVIVISRNPETRDGLQRYLTESGLQANALASVDADAVPSDASAVVLFPDDFSGQAIQAFARDLTRARPTAFMVLVTSELPRLELLLYGDPGSRVVLPRPSDGWSIVDAIRAHRDTVSPPR